MEPPTQHCAVCNGTGSIDERVRDLWLAGIVVHEASEEEFRSSPTVWRP